MDSNHRVTGYEPVILPTEVNPHLSGFLKYKQVARCRTQNTVGTTYFVLGIYLQDSNSSSRTASYLAVLTGFEPAISPVTGECLDHLDYSTINLLS